MPNRTLESAVLVWGSPTVNYKMDIRKSKGGRRKRPGINTRTGAAKCAKVSDVYNKNSYSRLTYKSSYFILR